MTGEADPTGGNALLRELRSRSRLEWITLCAVLLSFAGYVGFGLYSSHKATEAEELAKLEHQADVVTRNLAPRLQAVVNALDAIRAELPEHLALKDGPSLLSQHMAAAVSSTTGIRTISLTNAGGIVIASNRAELIGKDLHEGERYRFTSSRPDANMVYVSPHFVTPLGNWAVSLGRAVVDDQGKFGGYVLAIIDPDYWNLLLDSARYSSDVTAAIVHGDGKLIFRVPDPNGAAGIDLAGNPDSGFSQHIRSGEDRTLRTAIGAATDRKALFALQSIRFVAGPADGFLVASFSRETAAVFAPWRKALIEQLALLAGIALMTSLGLLVYQRRRETITRLQAGREEDRRFRTMANGAPVLIWMSGTDKLCNWFNEPWLAFTGRTMEQEMGNGWAEGVHPDDLQRCLDVYVGHFDRREPFSMEYRLRRHDGAFRWLVDNGKPLFDGAGNFTGYIGSCIDIDEAKRAESALRDRVGRLRAFFQSPGVGIAITAAGKGFVEVNDCFCAMLGYTREELLRVHWRELTHPDDVATDITEVNRLVSGESEAYARDKRYIRKDGTVIWVQLSASCTRRPDRSVEYVVAIVKDITKRKEAEDALRASEEHQRKLFDNLDAGIVVHAPDTSIVLSNVRAGILLGLTPDQMRGKVAIDPGWRFVREDGSAMPPPEYPVNQVVTSGSRVVAQVIGIDRSPSSRAWVLVNAYPEFDDARALRLVVVTFVDITRRREAEQALHASEQRLKAFLDSAGDSIFVLDAGTGRFVDCNPQACRELGYTRSELLARSASDIEERLTPDQVAATHRQALAETTGFVTGTHRRKDGTTFPVEIQINSLAPSQPELLIAVARNVSERAAADEALAAAHQQLNQHVTNTPLALVEWDADYRVTRFTARATEMFGWMDHEVIGKRVDEVPWVPEEDWPKVRAVMNAMDSGSGPNTVSLNRNVRKDGKVIHCEWYNSSLYGQDGKLASVFSLVQDVTDRKEAEERVREAAAYTRGLIEASLDPLVTISPEGKVTDVNQATEEATGVPRAQLVGTDFADYFTEPERARAGYERVLADGAVRDYPLTFRHRSGRTIEVVYNAVTYADAKQRPQGVFAAARDITDRKKAEEALRASEVRFRALADEAPVGIYQADAEGRNVYLNRAAEEILGQAQPAASGTGWHDALHPDDRDRVVREFAAAIRAGSAFESEYRFLRKDGTSVLARGFATALRDLAGTVTGYIGVVMDITALKALEGQLALTSRLAAMGTLVAGVAHEVNNPLAAVLADQGLASEVVQEVRDRLRTGEPLDREAEAKRLGEVVEELKDAEEGARRIEQIVKDLAKFARPNEEKTRVRVIDAVQQAMRWLPATVGRAATVSVEDGGAPDILASFGQIEQLVVNLVTNAAKASKPGEVGVVIVRTSPGSPGMSRLDVTDRGVGIDPAMRERIFDPFFTTRQVGEGKGMGLGLSICHTIAKAHGGTITVESDVGKGSTFRVELPVAPAES